MIEHGTTSSRPPERVVVIGAAGFVGGVITARLRRDGVPVLALTRAEIDLLAPDAADRLAGLLRPTDQVVAAAAMAPCKTAAMLKDNVCLAHAVASALARVKVAQVVNIGSDAVYGDVPVPLTEASVVAPDGLHGVMHLARETLFRAELAHTPLVLLRPTLIYGAGDPHDGYGPNRFRRLAQRGEDIVLFGEGEERRDHVCIDDIAEIAVGVLARRSRGILNLASGTVTSFRRVAEMVVEAQGRAVTIRGTPRSGPMPHNGYRAFDISGLLAAFPAFAPTGLAEGLARARNEEFAHG